MSGGSTISSGGGTATTPGGSTTQIQYNSSSTFAGAVGITYTVATRMTTFTPTGSPEYGFLVDGTGCTPNTSITQVTATCPSSSSLRVVDVNITGPSSSGSGTGNRVSVSGGSGSSGYFRCYYADTNISMSGSSLNPVNSNVGLSGYQVFTNNGSTTGSNYGYTATCVSGNVQVGLNAHVYGSIGANAKSYGIRAVVQATTGSGTAEAVGGYFKINATDPTTSTAGVSGALIADNGSTTNDILILMDGGTTKVKVTDAGNVVLSEAALATNATNGFVYIPTCAGAPTGAATAYTGTCAMVYDTSNNKLAVYNGAWKQVTLA